MKAVLGSQYRDRITGESGIAVGRCTRNGKGETIAPHVRLKRHLLVATRPQYVWLNEERLEPIEA